MKMIRHKNEPRGGVPARAQQGRETRGLQRWPQAGGWTEWPAIDVAEDEKAITVRADVPGLEPADLDVEVSGNLLTLRGKREDEWSESKAGVYRQERRSGSFARTISLPTYVQADKIEARYDKGTVTVTLPKQPGQGPKRVNITA